MGKMMSVGTVSGCTRGGFRISHDNRDGMVKNLCLTEKEKQLLFLML